MSKRLKSRKAYKRFYITKLLEMGFVLIHRGSQDKGIRPFYIFKCLRKDIHKLAAGHLGMVQSFIITSVETMGGFHSHKLNGLYLVDTRRDMKCLYYHLKTGIEKAGLDYFP